MTQNTVEHFWYPIDLLSGKGGVVQCNRESEVCLAEVPRLSTLLAFQTAVPQLPTPKEGLIEFQSIPQRESHMAEVACCMGVTHCPCGVYLILKKEPNRFAVHIVDVILLHI